MSKVYYLVCHEIEIAVAIGDDAAGDPYIWSEQIPHINNFLTISNGHPIFTVHEEDEGFSDWYDKYVILGEFN